MFRMGFRTFFLAALVLGHTTVGMLSSAEAKTPRCLGKEATIIGTEKNDDLQGTKAADVIVGLGGSDDIYGGRGDRLCGGHGKDFVAPSGGPVLIKGGTGRDGLFDTKSADKILGGPGRDRVWSERGNDALSGGRGVDTVIIAGPDWGDKHPPATAVLSVDLVLGESSGGGTGHKSLRAFENVRAGSWEVDQVVIRGDGRSNRLIVEFANHGAIFGGRGDDRLGGHYFADLLVGGRGNDRLAGGGNDDRLYGGRGRDTATFRRNASRGEYVEASLFTGLAYLHAGGSSTEGIARMRDIENLEGAPGNDSLIGNHRNNSLVGLGGRDRLLGNKRRDQLLGGRGVDRLNGGGGRNTNDGGEGEDYCVNPDKAAGALNCESP